MIGARDMGFRAQRLQLLDLRFGGLLLYFSYLGGSGLYGAAARLTSAGGPTAAALKASLPAIAPILDARHPAQRSRQHWNGAEYSGDDNLHALPRHEMNRMPLLVWLYW